MKFLISLLACFSVCLSLAGCVAPSSSARNVDNAYNNITLKPGEASYDGIATQASHRLVLSTPGTKVLEVTSFSKEGGKHTFSKKNILMPVICAEPSPDGGSSYGDFTKFLLEVDDHKIDLQKNITFNVTIPYAPSPAVKFYRDGVFALCQAAMNGWIETSHGSKKKNCNTEGRIRYQELENRKQALANREQELVNRKQALVNRNNILLARAEELATREAFNNKLNEEKRKIEEREISKLENSTNNLKSSINSLRNEKEEIWAVEALFHSFFYSLINSENTPEWVLKKKISSKSETLKESMKKLNARKKVLDDLLESPKKEASNNTTSAIGKLAKTQELPTWLNTNNAEKEKGRDGCTEFEIQMFRLRETTAEILKMEAKNAENQAKARMDESDAKVKISENKVKISENEKKISEYKAETSKNNRKAIEDQQMQQIQKEKDPASLSQPKSGTTP